MSVRVKWQEVNQSIQIPSATRDLAVDSVGDARDATVGAVVQFASAALDSHSMNWRIRQELTNLRYLVHARLRNHQNSSGRNDHGCLAVVIYAVNDVWFTGQQSTRFLACNLWGDHWPEHRSAIRNHDLTPRNEPSFGQWPNNHRYFWATIE